MLITFHCSKCQAELEGDAGMGGAAVQCPQCGQSLTVPSQSLGPGLTVGGFEIIRMLGEGGMGEVYLARQLSLGRNVALKILPAQMKLRRGVAERFFKEVKLLAQLEHANIVVAFEAGEDAGVMYLAMGYVNGESLEQKLRREGPLPEAEALAMTGKLAGALDYAWREHQLLHRDIKPSNIMLAAGGELKLMDFGLAKCLQEDTALTLSGTIMGTPNYMSPEQVEGNVALDCRADLYSLGATLYHMVTGTLPFAGSSVMETLRKQVSEALPDPRTINAAVSENCVTLLEIMLSKSRDQRHPDYRALMEDVQRVQAGKPPMREPLQAGESVLIRSSALGLARPAQPAARRGAPAKPGRKLIIGAAACAVLALGIVTLALVLRAPKPVAAQAAGALKVDAVQPGAAESPSSSQAPAETGKAPPGEALASLTKQYLEALSFSREHPEDYAGSLVLLEPLGKAAAGTELEGKVNDEIGRVGRVRKQAEDKAITALKEAVQAKVAEGDFEGALRRVELDTGLVTEATKAARAELAREVGAQKQAAEEVKVKQAADAEQQKQAAAAKEKLAALAQGLAADLLKGDAEGMIRRMTAAKADPVLGAAAGELSALNDQALQVVDWPEKVAQTFEESKGKAVTVEFKGGRKEQFTVTSVAGGRVQGQKQIAAGFIGREFAVSDLSAGEKLRRLGDDQRPALKVMRGLVQVRCANDWAAAGKEFASAGGLLAEALAKEAPGMQAPAAAASAAKPLEKPAEARAGEAVQAEPKKPEIARPVALKPATEETIKAALERLEKDNGGKLKSQYAIKGDGIELNLNNNPSLRDLGALSGLPLVKLELQKTGVEDLRPLVGMPLVFLDIKGTTVDNIKPLSKITTLKHLQMHATGIDDLNPLKGLRLTAFKCVNLKGIRDLTPLAGMPLEALDIAFSDSTSPKEMAANIAVMKDMPLGRGLSLGGPVIKDIKFLENFSSVRSLFLYLQVSDLSPLRGMKSLKELYMYGNLKIADIKVLKGMELIGFQIASMPITSLEPLADKGEKIKYLAILACPKLTDTDKIPEYFPNLASITIDPDFPHPEILARCANLQQISLSNGAPPISMEEFKKRFSKPQKKPAAEARADEALQAEPKEPDSALPVALKPATEETIKAALERLEKDNGGKLKSQYAIKGDGIELNLNNNPSLRDLGALSGLPLVKLELQYADVADLRPLVGMPLAYLDIEGNKVENIKPLSKIKTLNSLNMSFTRMYDLNPLKGLQLIKFVWVDSKGIRDLTPFAGMPLESLSVSFSDSTSPKEMAANIAVMKDMPLAVYLSLGGAVIKDIKFLETFLSSKSLTLVSTQVSDLSPLRGMKSLHSLRLGDNRKVVDFKALKGINLNILYIINMDITSLEPLAERGKLITYLTILACPKLTDTDKIPEYFPNLSFITIDPDFPRPEILTRCAKLNQIRFKEGAPFMTMEEFRKQFSKPAKQPGQK